MTDVIRPVHSKQVGDRRGHDH